MDGLKYNETLGTYYPGYFEIFVKTDKKVDLNKLNDAELSTFFHEWIHFLQDFTNGVGCNNSYTMIEGLKYLGKIAQNEYASTSNPVLVPLSYGTEMNVLANKFVNIKEWGTEPSSTTYENIINTENIPLPVPQEYTTAIQNIPICKVTTNTKETFEFGTRDIMESMASMCQCYIFPYTDDNKIPIYPYKTAKLVCEHLNPIIASDTLMMIALCDMSLMSSAPGAQFTSYLKGIIQGNISQPTTPEDIYDWFYRENAKMLEKYTIINELARRSFLGILRDPNVFKDYHVWINNAFGKALSLRTNDRYFLINMLRKGRLQSNSDFKTYLGVLGTPLLRNKTGDFTKIPLAGNVDEDVEHLQSIRMVIDILSIPARSDKITGNLAKPCFLYNWCINSQREQLKQGVDLNKLINPDSRCLSNPTLRVHDKKHCSLAHIWFAMNLPPVIFE